MLWQPPERRNADEAGNSRFDSNLKRAKEAVAGRGDCAAGRGPFRLGGPRQDQPLCCGLEIGNVFFQLSKSRAEGAHAAHAAGYSAGHSSWTSSCRSEMRSAPGGRASESNLRGAQGRAPSVASTSRIPPGSSLKSAPHRLGLIRDGEGLHLSLEAPEPAAEGAP